MPEFVIIPVEDIIAENFRQTGAACDERRRQAVAGCYSSFHYYYTPQERIACIVASLLKGHFFMDGNKRTALSTYIVLCQANNLPFIEDTQKQADAFVKLAAAKNNISGYVILFPAD